MGSENGVDDSLPSIPVCFPSQESTSLGNVTYRNIVSAVANIVNDHKGCFSATARKRGNYNHYSPKMHAKIGKYAIEDRNSKAIEHFKAGKHSLNFQAGL